jgi:hypothetical protein
LETLGSVDAVPGPVITRLTYKVFLTIISHVEYITLTHTVSTFSCAVVRIFFRLPFAPAPLLFVGEEIFFETKVIVGTGYFGLSRGLSGSSLPSSKLVEGVEGLTSEWIVSQTNVHGTLVTPAELIFTWLGLAHPWGLVFRLCNISLLIKPVINPMLFNEKRDVTKPEHETPWMCESQPGEDELCWCNQGTMYIGLRDDPLTGESLDTFDKLRTWKTATRKASGQTEVTCTYNNFGLKEDFFPDKEKRCWCEWEPKKYPHYCAAEGGDCMCKGNVFYMADDGKKDFVG